MRTSIATVCLSGTLTQKMHACAEAGFDGIEVFEPDLVTTHHSPEEIRALADRLDLRLDLYQPFRDAEGVDADTFEANLRRAEAKFALMRRLGMDTMLVCSNVATATVDDDKVSAAQLRAMGELAEVYGVRLAFEALAWGRFVDDYRRAWRIVELADHPNVGVCLDSFHILSRGHDPRAIEDIPGEKVFFLQLADAPALSMDVLSWSRHHRLFPGEGSFDLAGFLAHVVRTGYDGPLSLEVFNDTFRQTDPERTARQALRSLRWLEDQASRRLDGRPGPALTRLPDVAHPAALDFVEVKAEDTADVEVVLRQLGFTFRGRHRSKPVRLWTQGGARVVCNEQQARDVRPTLAAVGFEMADPSASAERAGRLMAPQVSRRTYAGEEQLHAHRGSGRHRGVPRPGIPGRGPGLGGGVRGRRAAAARRAGQPRRPCQPRPALAALRRGGALLRECALARAPAVRAGRRPGGPGPQPGDALARRVHPARAEPPPRRARLRG